MLLGALLAGALLAGAAAGAHGVAVGDLKIQHPYATPTPPGSTVGAAYFKSIRNDGKVADRLTGATSSVAARIELHRSTMDGDVMRMRNVSSVDLPAGAEVPMGHGTGYHLMLIDLKQPLKVGDRFDMELTFEHAGKVTAKVVVQQPKVGDGGTGTHMH